MSSLGELNPNIAGPSGLSSHRSEIGSKISGPTKIGTTSFYTPKNSLLNRYRRLGKYTHPEAPHNYSRNLNVTHKNKKKSSFTNLLKKHVKKITQKQGIYTHSEAPIRVDPVEPVEPSELSTFPDISDPFSGDPIATKTTEATNKIANFITGELGQAKKNIGSGLTKIYDSREQIIKNLNEWLDDDKKLQDILTRTANFLGPEDSGIEIKLHKKESETLFNALNDTRKTVIIGLPLIVDAINASIDYSTGESLENALNFLANTSGLESNIDIELPKTLLPQQIDGNSQPKLAKNFARTVALAGIISKVLTGIPFAMISDNARQTLSSDMAYYMSELIDPHELPKDYFDALVGSLTILGACGDVVGAKAIIKGAIGIGKSLNPRPGTAIVRSTGATGPKPPAGISAPVLEMTRDPITGVFKYNPPGAPGDALVHIPASTTLPVPSRASLPVPPSTTLPVPSRTTLPVPSRASLPVPSRASLPVPPSTTLPVPPVVLPQISKGLSRVPPLVPSGKPPLVPKASRGVGLATVAELAKTTTETKQLVHLPYKTVMYKGEKAVEIADPAFVDALKRIKDGLEAAKRVQKVLSETEAPLAKAEQTLASSVATEAEKVASTATKNGITKIRQEAIAEALPTVNNAVEVFVTERQVELMSGLKRGVLGSSIGQRRSGPSIGPSIGQRRSISTLGYEVDARMRRDNIERLLARQEALVITATSAVNELIRKGTGKTTKTFKGAEDTLAQRIKVRDTTVALLKKYPGDTILAISTPAEHTTLWVNEVLNSTGKYHNLLKYEDNIKLRFYNSYYPISDVNIVEEGLGILSDMVRNLKPGEVASYRLIPDKARTRFKEIFEGAAAAYSEEISEFLSDKLFTSKCTVLREQIENMATANLMKELESAFNDFKGSKPILPKTQRNFDILRAYLREDLKKPAGAEFNDFKSFKEVKEFLYKHGDHTLSFDHPLDLQTYYKHAERLGIDLSNFPSFILDEFILIVNDEILMILVVNSPNISKGGIVKNAINAVCKREQIDADFAAGLITEADKIALLTKLDELTNAMRLLDGSRTGYASNIVTLFEDGKVGRQIAIDKLRRLSELPELTRLRDAKVAELTRMKGDLARNTLKPYTPPKKVKSPLPPSPTKKQAKALVTIAEIDAKIDILKELDLEKYSNQLKQIVDRADKTNKVIDGITMDNFKDAHKPKNEFRRRAENLLVVTKLGPHGVLQEEIPGLKRITGGNGSTVKKNTPTLLDTLIADAIDTAFIFSDDDSSRERPYTEKEIEEIDTRYDNLPNEVEDNIMEHMVASMFNVPFTRPTSEKSVPLLQRATRQRGPTICPPNTSVEAARVRADPIYNDVNNIASYRRLHNFITAGTGQRCYMNSALQMLYSVQEFRNFFITDPTTNNTWKPIDTITNANSEETEARKVEQYDNDTIKHKKRLYAMYYLFLNMGSRDRNTLNTEDIYFCINNTLPIMDVYHTLLLEDFTPDRQQDTVEFIDVILRLLQYSNVAIYDIFKVKYTTTQKRTDQALYNSLSGLSGLRAPLQKVTYADVTRIGIQIVANNNIQQLIENEFRIGNSESQPQRNIPDMVYQYKPDERMSVDISGAGIEYTSIEILPETQCLFIQLGRFFDTGDKNTSNVPFTPLLTIDRYNFIIKGCIVHMGNTPQSGHYYYYTIKITDSNYIIHKINDAALIVSVPFNTFRTDIETNGYLFLYEKTERTVIPTFSISRIRTGPQTLKEEYKLYNTAENITNGTKHISGMKKNMKGKLKYPKAIRDGDFEVVEELIGHDPVLKQMFGRYTIYGITPLNYAIRNYAEDALKKNRMKIMEALLDGAKIRAIELFEAADNDSYDTLLKMLIEKGGNINLQDSNGNTLLHYMLWERHYNIYTRNPKSPSLLTSDKSIDRWKEFIDWLMKHGANLTLQNKKGQTPLHIALLVYSHPEYKFGDIIREMVNRGAPLNIKSGANTSENTPFFSLVSGCIYEKNLTELQMVEIITTINLCIEKGAELNTQDSRGNTLLHYLAGELGKTVSSSITYRADTSPQAEKLKTQHGFSSPFIPIYSDNRKIDWLIIIINLFIAKGALINIVDKKGAIPLDYLNAYKFPEYVHIVNHSNNERVVELINPYIIVEFSKVIPKEIYTVLTPTGTNKVKYLARGALRSLFGTTFFGGTQSEQQINMKQSKHKTRRYKRYLHRSRKAHPRK